MYTVYCAHCFLLFVCFVCLFRNSRANSICSVITLDVLPTPNLRDFSLYQEWEFHECLFFPTSRNAYVSWTWLSPWGGGSLRGAGCNGVEVTDYVVLQPQDAALVSGILSWPQIPRFENVLWWINPETEGHTGQHSRILPLAQDLAPNEKQSQLFTE